jgi:hypothetical protein
MIPDMQLDIDSIEAQDDRHRNSFGDRVWQELAHLIPQ